MIFSALPQVVSIDHYTFRVKDILFINQHVQQRIVDDEWNQSTPQPPP